jgi:hypothetical protein
VRSEVPTSRQALAPESNTLVGISHRRCSMVGESLFSAKSTRMPNFAPVISTLWGVLEDGAVYRSLGDHDHVVILAMLKVEAVGQIVYQFHFLPECGLGFLALYRPFFVCRLQGNTGQSPTT